MRRSDREWNAIYKHMDAGTCYVCGKPVATGSAIYGLTGAHYDCEMGSSQLDNSVKSRAPTSVATELDSRLKFLKSRGSSGRRRARAREGEGPTAQKVIAKAVAAIEKVSGAKVSDVTFWNQKGSYRGNRWDLARWGLIFCMTYEDGFSTTGDCHSWSTIGACAPASLTMVAREEMSHSYNVEPQ